MVSDIQKRKNALRIQCEICNQTVSYRLTPDYMEKIKSNATYYPYPVFFHHKDHYLFAYIDKSVRTARETMAIGNTVSVKLSDKLPDPKDGFQYKPKNMFLVMEKDASYTKLKKVAKESGVDKKIPVFAKLGDDHWLIFMDHTLSVISTTYSTLLFELDHQ